MIEMILFSYNIFHFSTNINYIFFNSYFDAIYDSKREKERGGGRRKREEREEKEGWKRELKKNRRKKK